MQKIDPETAKPPHGLSAEAQEWWRRLVNEYQIDDQAGRLLLQTALEALDRLRDAQATLQAEGAVISDRFGQRKQHPAVTTERDARSAMIQALKSLNLDVEPARDGPGRPPEGGKV